MGVKECLGAAEEGGESLHRKSMESSPTETAEVPEAESNHTSRMMAECPFNSAKKAKAESVQEKTKI